MEEVAKSKVGHLGTQQNERSRLKRHIAELTVIIAPDDSPVTYTLLASPLYVFNAYLTIFASPVLSPPPSCFSV